MEQGATTPQIADALFITTVKSHIRHILEKIQLEKRTQVAAYAVQSGLFPRRWMRPLMTETAVSYTSIHT